MAIKVIAQRREGQPDYYPPHHFHSQHGREGRAEGLL